MRTSRAASASILATTAASVLVVAPAHADAVLRNDPRGDVFQYNIDNVNPRAKDPDAVRLSVAHRASAVVVDVKYRDLIPGGHHDFRLTMSVDGEQLRAIGMTGDADTTGELEISDLISDEASGLCPEMRGRFDHDLDTLRVRMPRSCLGNPTWVKVGLNTAFTAPPVGEEPSVTTVDTVAQTKRVHR